MSKTTDWDTLIQKHLDGQSSIDGAEALSEQIVRDAEVRARYLKAAQVHGALADEVLALDLSEKPTIHAEPVEKRQRALSFAWPQQLVAAIVAGVFMGLIGFGVAWAVGSPESEARIVSVTNGGFEKMSGPVDIGFPTQFGHWSGNPAAVVQEPDGNHVLRFLETGNVMGDPGGGASNCSVFQLIDLTSLRSEWDPDRSESQRTLELSARFRREAAPNDADLPKLDASVRIYLFQGEPEFISRNWPGALRNADALGKQSIKLNPGDEAATVSTSCLLNSEATLALIAVSANTRAGGTTPVELGGYFVDDVQLTAIRHPVLPVRFVK